MSDFQQVTFKRAVWFVGFSLLLATCRQAPNSDTKFQQYYVEGEQLYLKNCSNCHQKKGDGLGRVYPPLHKSDYMEQYFEEVICSIKYGKDGEIIVNGKKYNKKMNGIASLTSLEIAELATYIYNTWEHQRGIIEMKKVDEALLKCQE